MKKLLLAFALCLTVILLISCGEDGPTEHTHVGGSATCESGRICDECGEEYTDPRGHKWEYVADDENTHTMTCTREGCTATQGAEAHSGGVVSCTQGG